jgi:transposase-like protein
MVYGIRSIPMGKIKRKFDVQFKTSVVQAIQTGTHTLKEICQEHQLQRQTVDRWIERFSLGKLTERPSLREKMLEKEVDKLKSKIGDLVMQIDLLKKFHEELARKKSVDSSVITARNLVQFQQAVKP